MNSHPIDISNVTSQYLCNSCGACFASCNQGAISFSETMGGYVFPQIASETCTRCGSCYNVCPGMHFNKTLCAKLPQDPFVGNIIGCEVGRATDEAIFLNSQSGGVATALLTYLFEAGCIEAAIVAVMLESTPPRGDVLLVTKPENLFRAQKSKYTPIPLLKAMHEINRLKGAVALVGLPCHMHGLYNLVDALPVYRKNEFYRIGLICDRVMTTAAIDFMGRKATKLSVHNFIFRDKRRPVYPGNPVVFANTNEGILLDASLRIAIKDFFTPARCRLCFDKLNIFADVVLGDPHEIEGVDRVLGESLVLVRTEKGKKLIDSCKAKGAIVLRKTPVEAALKGQGVVEKRREWAGYMQAWKDLGRNQPHYPFVCPTPDGIKRHKQRLLQGLRLDEFKSRAELMRAVDSWLYKNKVSKAAFLAFSKLKSLMCSIRTKSKL